MYKYGNICIPKQTLINFLKGIGKGQYTTFDILEKYQGRVDRNAGISAQQSWNANFGKILNQCAKDPNANVIKLLASNQKIVINGGSTNTAYWEIY